VLTVYEENERVIEALCAGAMGYLLKNTPPSRPLDALREPVVGGAPISPKIARKVSAAGELGVTINTIAFHVRSIYDKLKVHSKSEAVARALREKLLE